MGVKHLKAAVHAAAGLPAALGRCLVVIGLLLSSCAYHAQEAVADKTFRLSSDEMKFSDWTSLISIEEIVPLEDNEDSLLTVAQKCVMNGERILFWDFKMKCVYVYDRGGKFLFTVGRQGGAGFECVDLRDIYIGESGDSRIELLDAMGILMFDAADGRFMGKKKLASSDMTAYYKFMPLSEDKYLLYSPTSEYSVYEFSGGEIVGLRKRGGHQLVTDYFYRYGDECLVLPDYGSFVISAYNGGEMRAKYDLDLGRMALPRRDLPETGGQFVEVDKQSGYFKSVATMMESDNWLFVRLVGPSQTYYFCYNKQSERVWTGPSDLSSGLSVIDIEGNDWYGLIYPEFISEENALYKEVKRYLVNGMESNPLLVRFRMKED